jgi:hypothetical protein
MQMRINSAVGFGWARVAATLAIAAAVFAIAAPAVNAQTSQSSTVGAIRLGAYIPVNTNTQETYGRYFFAGGLDYYFQNTTSERDLVSADYTEYSKGANDLRVIPVTLGQQTTSGSTGQSTRPYVGYGIGAYFVHISNPNDANLGGSTVENGIAFGGYIGAGLDIGSNLFLDARYHIVTPVKDVNTDSLELTAGLRF